jgi:hypothetical protein
MDVVVEVQELADLSDARYDRLVVSSSRLPLPVCDYCGRGHDDSDLASELMGLFMCRRCRDQIDAATRSRVFTFRNLLDFVLLRSASSATGAPVAVGVCLAPFSGLMRDLSKKPWWLDVKFWNRGRGK